MGVGVQEIRLHVSAEGKGATTENELLFYPQEDTL